MIVKEKTMKLKELLPLFSLSEKVRISGRVHDTQAGETPESEFELIVNDVVRAVQDLPDILLNCTVYCVAYSRYHEQICLSIMGNGRTGILTYDELHKAVMMTSTEFCAKFKA